MSTIIESSWIKKITEARTYARQHDFDTASDIYVAIMRDEKAPREIRELAFTNYALLLAENGHTEQALQIFEELLAYLEDETRRAVTTFFVGTYIATIGGRTDEAIEKLQEVVPTISKISVHQAFFGQMLIERLEEGPDPINPAELDRLWDETVKKVGPPTSMSTLIQTAKQAVRFAGAR